MSTNPRRLGGLLLLVLACRGDSADRRRALDDAPARQLVGAWDATLWLDRPVALSSQVQSPPRSISGSVAFLTDRVGEVSSEEMPDPTHVGTYAIDFRPFGMEQRDAAMAPVAIARTRVHDDVSSSGTTLGAARDSVSIILDPGTWRSVRLHGTFVGDSIVGTWTASRGLGGGGRFSLRAHAVGVHIN